MYIFRNFHDQAVIYCVCVCMIELTRETGRIDTLRAVNSGGTVVGKVVNSFVSRLLSFQPTHEIMALIALRKLSLQTRMRSKPLGLHILFLVRPFIYFHTLCVRTAKDMRSLTRAFAVCLCDKYHISWAGSFQLLHLVDNVFYVSLKSKLHRPTTQSITRESY